MIDDENIWRIKRKETKSNVNFAILKGTITFGKVFDFIKPVLDSSHENTAVIAPIASYK
jgi:hypothetical protein